MEDWWEIIQAQRLITRIHLLHWVWRWFDNCFTLKKWWVESDFKAPNLPLSLRLKVSGCHYNSIYSNTWTKQVKQLSNQRQTQWSKCILVPSHGHYGFHSFPVDDWFCLFIYLWVFTFPLLDCSEFGNFVITLIV
jgi:hypothetical protein